MTLEEGTSIKKLPESDSPGRLVCEAVWIDDGWAQPTIIGSIPGEVCLGAIRKQAEHAGNEAVNSVHPWFLVQVPA